MRLNNQQARRLGILKALDRDPAVKARRAAKQAKERTFDSLCEAHGLPVPVQEYRFAEPRKWRFDYLWDGWLALEVQGGLFTAGRHVQGAALLEEHEKLNEAVIRGYSVLFCTPADIKTGAAFALVKRALEAKEEMP